MIDMSKLPPMGDEPATPGSADVAAKSRPGRRARNQAASPAVAAAGESAGRRWIARVAAVLLVPVSVAVAAVALWHPLQLARGFGSMPDAVTPVFVVAAAALGVVAVVSAVLAVVVWRRRKGSAGAMAVALPIGTAAAMVATATYGVFPLTPCVLSCSAALVVTVALAVAAERSRPSWRLAGVAVFVLVAATGSQLFGQHLVVEQFAASLPARPSGDQAVAAIVDPALASPYGVEVRAFYGGVDPAQQQRWRSEGYDALAGRFELSEDSCVEEGSGSLTPPDQRDDGFRWLRTGGVFYSYSTYSLNPAVPPRSWVRDDTRISQVMLVPSVSLLALAEGSPPGRWGWCETLRLLPTVTSLQSSTPQADGSTLHVLTWDRDRVLEAFERGAWEQLEMLGADGLLSVWLQPMLQPVFTEVLDDTPTVELVTGPDGTFSAIRFLDPSGAPLEVFTLTRLDARFDVEAPEHVDMTIRDWSQLALPELAP